MFLFKKKKPNLAPSNQTNFAIRPPDEGWIGAVKRLRDFAEEQINLRVVTEQGLKEICSNNLEQLYRGIFHGAKCNPDITDVFEIMEKRMLTKLIDVPKSCDFIGVTSRGVCVRCRIVKTIESFSSNTVNLYVEPGYENSWIIGARL